MLRLVVQLSILCIKGKHKNSTGFEEEKRAFLCRLLLWRSLEKKAPCSEDSSLTQGGSR